MDDGITRTIICVVITSATVHAPVSQMTVSVHAMDFGVQNFVNCLIVLTGEMKLFSNMMLIVAQMKRVTMKQFATVIFCNIFDINNA